MYASSINLLRFVNSVFLRFLQISIRVTRYRTTNIMNYGCTLFYCTPLDSTCETNRRKYFFFSRFIILYHACNALIKYYQKNRRSCFIYAKTFCIILIMYSYCVYRVPLIVVDRVYIPRIIIISNTYIHI